MLAGITVQSSEVHPRKYNRPVPTYTAIGIKLGMSWLDKQISKTHDLKCGEVTNKLDFNTRKNVTLNH